MVSRFVLGVLLVLSASAPAVARMTKPAGTLREQQEQACSADAMKLCGDFVPDEAKITVCMTAKKAKLSPACKKVFK